MIVIWTNLYVLSLGGNIWTMEIPLQASLKGRFVTRHISLCALSPWSIKCVLALEKVNDASMATT